MARILVLGAGVMGTAITVPIADNGHDVRLVGTHLDTDIIEEIHENRHHPKLKTTVPESVKPFMLQQLEEAFDDIELVILGVNSLGIRWAAETLTQFIRPDIPVLFLTKGMEGNGEKLLRLPEVFQETLPKNLRDQVRMAAIGGPSIAGELAARKQTAAVVTGEDPRLLESIQAMLETPYYHVPVNTDVIGVEVSVGFKNLYSIGVGIVQGMQDRRGDPGNREEMHNLAGVLFAQSLKEMAYMVEKMGGRRETVFSLLGIGDLYVTCQGGRNSRLGRHLGSGLTIEEARSRYLPGDTVEGAEIAFAVVDTVHALIAEGTFDSNHLRLLRIMLDILCNQAPASASIEAYFEQLNLHPH